MRNIFVLVFAVCVLVASSGCDDQSADTAPAVASNPLIDTSRPIVTDPIIIDDTTTDDTNDDTTDDTNDDTTDDTNDDTTDDTNDEDSEDTENLINNMFGNDGIDGNLLDNLRNLF
jgi:hypothetical protein